MCGLRRGEILGLAWEHVDLDGSTLHVSQTLQQIGGKLQLAQTKTEGGERTLKLPASVVKALKAHRVRQLEQRLKAGASWQETRLVFTNQNGGPVQPITLHRDWKDLLKSAGLPVETRFHDLRHSAASLLLNQGVPLKMISEMLGHSSISITANIYGHVSDNAKQEVANMMESVVGKA